MHPVFAAIQFGPFKSEYHQSAVDEDFREALSGYLVAQLLPQVDEPFDSTAGKLTAAYDDQKYCGPNSAVCDLYSFEFEFRRKDRADAIRLDLAYSRGQRTFSPRHRGKPLYLWTASRREEQHRRANDIRAVCNRILRGEIASAQCPSCGAALQVIHNPGLFGVSCPEGCFRSNHHRDPQTGEFQHGHFFCGPPKGV